MPDVQPYYTFLQAHAQRSREDFLSVVTRPHLYFPSLPELEGSAQFHTLKYAPGGAPPDLGQQGIVAIDKGEKSNAFAMMITMGRAVNNDLVVPDQRVSKFHAYFRQVGGRWTITDANSTNGTVVDTVRLAPERSHYLTPSARIRLSDAIDALFLPPAELFAMLQDARSWVC